jgi:hypothetical protein
MSEGSAGTKGSSSSTERAQASTQEFLKLLISLASGVLALSVTFVAKFLEGSGWAVFILFGSWILLAFSIYFGIRSLTILTRCIMNDTEMWWNQVVGSARYCWWCFLGGIVCLIIFAGVVFWINLTIQREHCVVKAGWGWETHVNRTGWIVRG